jgi:hypothetical protein
MPDASKRTVPLKLATDEAANRDPQPAREADPLESVPPPAPIGLEPPEQELLAEELAALQAALPPERRAPYQTLAGAAQAGTIPPDQIPLLERVLELILGSGRVRHTHRAEGERILQALYKRTPRGAAADQELAQVNKALAALTGQPISKVTASSRIPGHYTLMIDTGTLHLEVSLNAKGLTIEKAGV